jgi:hypothetical protein
MRLLAVAAISIALVLTLHAQAQFSFDYPAIARTLVRQLALRPGEKVLSVAHPGFFEELLPHIRYEVMKAGGVDLGVIDVLPEPVPASWDLEVVARGARAAREHYKAMLRDVDAAIMMPGAVPAHPVYGAMQDWLNAGRGRTVHFHWVENGSAYVLPGQPMPPRHVIDATYQRALLTTDYRALAASLQRFETAMRGQDVHITSPLGTDLRFRIGDRPVNRQDGDASAARTAEGVILIDREIELPAGAVRVAPIEESVDGTIAFPPSQWNGRPVEGLRLRFTRGRVTEIAASSGREAVDAEMARAGDAGRAFREFALGLNPALAVPETNPWIPYYGYGAGVVRLSLGDNSELGGKVTGGYVRWNFFTDPTVTVGTTTWVRDGKLVN